MVHYKKSKTLFHGKRIDVLSIEFPQASGEVIVREVVAHPGAVVILPLLDPETVILIRNTREAVQEVLWELPAGTLESGEEPLKCAYRELEEETGYQAKTMTPFFECYSSPGFCNEKLHFFVAEELTFFGQKLEATEKIEVFPVSIKDIHKMLKAQEIRDAKTLCGLLFFLKNSHQ